jgi:hypothetical protein
MSGAVTLTTGSLAEETLSVSALNALAAGITAQVDEGAVGLVELADGSIPAAKLDPAISEQLGLDDGSITTAKLAPAAFSADATGRAKMADGFVTAEKLAAGAVGTTNLGAAAVTAAKLASSVVTANVQNATITNSFTLASGSWRDITGLSVTITPRSASSKIWLMAMVHGSSDNFNSFGIRFVANGTAIGVGDAVGSRLRTGSVVCPGSQTYSYTADNSGNTGVMHFLHSHGVTSAITFKVQAYHDAATMYINRSKTDTDAAYSTRAISTLIALEVGA